MGKHGGGKSVILRLPVVGEPTNAATTTSPGVDSRVVMPQLVNTSGDAFYGNALYYEWLAPPFLNVSCLMSKNLILLAYGCLVASSAFAQQMYKSVGADGKITFSDRPALEKSKKLSVMRSYVLRPVENHSPAPDPATAKNKALDGPVINPNATVTPEVEEAMINVMGLTEFGRRYLPTCSATEQGARAFSEAAGKWRQRNSRYIEHQKRLLMEVVSPQKRAELQDRTAVYVDELGKTAPRSFAGRKEWCEGTIQEMHSGQTDINRPVMLTVPIVQYKAK